MKKINAIALGAALAGALFFASCKNQVEMYNVTNVTYANNYVVSGDCTREVVDTYAYKDGTASKSFTKTTIEKYTIKDSDVPATVYWTESEVAEGNYQAYNVKFTTNTATLETTVKTSSSTTSTTTTTENQKLAFDGSGEGYELITVYKVDDTYYVIAYGKLFSLGDIDLESGVSFSIKFTTSLETVDPNTSFYDSDTYSYYDDAKCTTTLTETFNLTFTAK